MKRALVAAMMLCAGTALAQPAPVPVESHLIAAKRAAGLDFPGTLVRLCVAPQANIGGGTRGAIPDRATWYAGPQKVFDNLYWVGTKVHSSWALKGQGGIILIDTLYNYAAEPEIVEGLKTLGLNPADIKYVIVSHGHGDHDEGAKLLQDRFGAHVVMSAADWDMIEHGRPVTGGTPRHDMVGADGQVITLGDVSVKLIATPGHTMGTLSAIFTVKDHGAPLTVVYSGGTAITGFERDPARLATYIASQKKLADAAVAAGATVLLSNHSEFDNAYDKARLSRLRGDGEASPFAIGPEAIARYFTVTGECAQMAKLKATP